MEDSPLQEATEGRYREFKTIGRGGMGIVYLALDTGMNRRVAIKIVRPDRIGAAGDCDGDTGPFELTLPAGDSPSPASHQTITARFLQEALVTGGLEHPGIVPVYELGRTPGGIPYYTMRLIRGERTLATAIAGARTQGDRLGLLEAFLRICDTMSYAHSRGVIHRDLKPENIALGEFGEVVLLDWGLARIADRPDLAEERWQGRLQELRKASDLKTLASALGTPGYMAPEAALGDSKRVDTRADVYSLGVILYEILTGRLPHEFEGFGELIGKLLREDPEAPHLVSRDVPEGLSAICLGALHREPEERTSGAAELAKSVRAWQRESAVEKEARALIGEADALYEEAEGLAGEDLLRRLDQVTGLCSRVLLLVPELPRAKHLARMCTKLREAAIRDREQAARFSTLRRVAVYLTLLLVLGSAGAFWLFREKAKVADQVRARDLADASRRVGEEDGTLALLLAIEAMAADPHPEVVRQLRHALAHCRERAILEDPFEAGYGIVRIFPDGKRILAISRRTLSIFDRDGRELLRKSLVDAAAPRPVTYASISPRGDRFVLSGKAKQEQSMSVVYDLDAEPVFSMTHLVRAPGPPAMFSRDGEAILSAGPQGAPQLFDLTGAAVLVFPVDRVRPARLLRFFAGSRRVLFAPEDEPGVTMFDADAVKIGELRVGEEQVDRPVVSPDRDRILARVGGAAHRLWDRDGKELASFPHGVESPPGPVFDARGRRFVSAFSGRTAIVHDRDGNRIAELVGHSARIRGMSWSRDGSRVLTFAADRTVRLWSATGEQVAVLTGHRRALGGASFTSAGDGVITWAADGVVRFFDLAGEFVGSYTLPGHKARRLQTVAPLRPGDRLLVGSVGGVLRIIARDRTETDEGWTPDGDVVRSPDGRREIRLSEGGEATLETVGTEQTVVLTGHQGPIRGAAFVPGEDGVITWSADGTVKRWDSTGRSRGTLLVESPVLSVLFLEKAGRVLTLDESGRARLWNFETGLLKDYGTPADHFTAVAVSPTTGQVALGLLDGSLLGGRRIHREAIRGMAFSPRHDLLATGADDGSIRVTDSDGRPIAEPAGHRGPVLSVRFSPDGDRLLTRGVDGEARVWILDDEELLRAAKQRVCRGFSAEEWEEYRALLPD